LITYSKPNDKGYFLASIMNGTEVDIGTLNDGYKAEFEKVLTKVGL